MQTVKGQWLSEYINELSKNVDKKKNRQLLTALNTAVNRVMNNPTCPDFIKSDIGEYRAVDVLPQIRLFFKIESKHDAVFFVWMNDLKEHPHDSSRGQEDKCYKEFKRLSNNDKLDKFVPMLESRSAFKMNHSFRSSKEIFAQLSNDTEFASSGLKLNRINNDEYNLENIYESEYNSKALKELISKVCAEADKQNIDLKYTLEKYREDIFKESVQKALLSNNFTITKENEETLIFMYKHTSQQEP